MKLTQNKINNKFKIDYTLISKSYLWSKKLVKVRKILKKIFLHSSYFVDKKFLQYDITFLLANNEKIKKINKKFNNINKSTDVLTFTDSYKYKNKNIRICNIILSAETIINEAKLMKINFYEHLTHLIIHSLLHSNGYDHDNLKNEKKMKKKEIEILVKLNINNPYA